MRGSSRSSGLLIPDINKALPAAAKPPLRFARPLGAAAWGLSCCVDMPTTHQAPRQAVRVSASAAIAHTDIGIGMTRHCTHVATRLFAGDRGLLRTFNPGDQQAGLSNSWEFSLSVARGTMLQRAEPAPCLRRGPAPARSVVVVAPYLLPGGSKMPPCKPSTDGWRPGLDRSSSPSPSIQCTLRSSWDPYPLGLMHLPCRSCTPEALDGVLAPLPPSDLALSVLDQRKAWH